MSKRLIVLFLLSVVSASSFWNDQGNTEEKIDESKRLVKFSVDVEERIKATKSQYIGSMKYQTETKDEAQLKLTKNMEVIKKFLRGLVFDTAEITITTDITKNKKSKSIPNPYGGLASSDDQEEEKFTGVISVNIQSKKVDLLNNLNEKLEKHLGKITDHFFTDPSFDNNLGLEFKLLEKAFARVDSISKKIESIMHAKVKKIHRAKWKPVKIEKDSLANYASRASMKNNHLTTASLKLDIALELES